MSLLLKYPEPQKNLPPPSPLPHKFKRNGHVRIEADIWKLSSQRQLCITKISRTSTSPKIKCKYEIDSPIEKKSFSTGKDASLYNKRRVSALYLRNEQKKMIKMI